MVRPTSETRAEEAADRDERLGEAIEAYLALAEAGQAPEAQDFAARYPDVEEDLLASIEGLALVRGLVGEPCGPGHRLESGHRVAGYRIVRELGRGGMGIVYEAVHVGLDRPVALKVLGSSAAPDSSGRRLFLNEARTAAGLHHTHIVPVFDVGQVGGLCYYAMQRIEGAGLDRVIKHLRRDRTVAAGSTYPGRAPSNPTAVPMMPDLSGTGLLGESTATWGAGGRKLPGLGRREDEATPFEPPRGSAYYRWVAAVGRQAAEALAHAHQRGVIHRDVKPSNLLVDARGAVWMADFGLARRLADPSQTQIDSLLGTPRYMSPEQAKTGPIDGRSDVYSLGATLYELLTLRPPFEGKTAAELIDQIAGREPVSIHAIDPRVPRDLETIVLKALHKRAIDRYASAAELSDDLERFLNHEPVRARRIGPLGRAWRIVRRHPSLTAVSAVATAVVLATAAFAYVRVVHERDQKADTAAKLETTNRLLEGANLKTRSALFDELRQNVLVQRLSGAAGRRDAGLAALKKAAALAPGPAEEAKLRDEAVAFLALRDVGERREIPIDDRDRASGLVLDADGRHLAVLSGDYETVRIYDVETRAQVATRSLAADRPPAGGPRPPGPVAGPGQGRGGPGRGPGIRPGTRIAAAGTEVAVIQPDGRGVSLVDAATGALADGGDLRLFDRPGQPPREIVSLAASADGDRLVTVDHPLDIDGTRRGGRFEFSVHLWDTAAPGKLLATLYEPPGAPGELTRGGFPLVAISPDGATVAVAISWFDPEISIWTRDGKSRAT
ncbi:MAG TPA: serine/threonine-protein kinase, partial [Isosphaeraceae bacterium]